MRGLFPMLALAVVVLADSGRVAAQGGEQMVRLSRLVIDSAQLEAYKAALKEADQRIRPARAWSAHLVRAFCCGFCDQPAFTRAFSRAERMSPALWRKTNG
jgi:hypothetical protein